MSRSIPSISFLFIAALFLVGYSFMFAEWTPATDTPPDGNTPAPINVGLVTQAKSGNLAANIFAATAEMRSDRYCDSLGSNCFNTADMNSVANLPTCTQGQTLVADAAGVWVCGTATTPPTTSWLVNNQHSESQCTSLGGTVLTDGSGGKFCQFTASACPSGWAKHQNWAAYRVTTTPCGQSTCTSPARAWSNTAGAPAQNTSCRGINGSDSWTPFQCTSAMNQVGCY